MIPKEECFVFLNKINVFLLLHLAIIGTHFNTQSVVSYNLFVVIVVFLLFVD